MAALIDQALVVVGGRLRAKHVRFLPVLGNGEDRVGVREVDDAEGIRVGNVGPRRPFCDQPRGVNLVIVVAQEADVHLEVVNQVRQYPLTHLGRVGGTRRHQLGGDGGHDQFQAAWHVFLRYLSSARC